MEKHSGFYKVRLSYIMTKYSYVFEKYINNYFWENFNLSDYSQDMDFVKNIDNDIEYIKNIVPEYKFDSTFLEFEELVKETSPWVLVCISNLLNKEPIKTIKYKI